MPEFTQDWFTPHQEHLREVLGHLVGRQARGLEIGCFEGRGSLWFLDNILTHPGSSLMCVDTFAGSAEHQEMGMDFSPVEQRWRMNTRGRNCEVFVGTSARFFFHNFLGFDFIFIDGSHEAADVLADSIHAWRVLLPGGILIWDDYGWDRYPEPEKNPRLAIDSFLSCYKGRWMDLRKGYRVSVKKP